MAPVGRRSAAGSINLNMGRIQKENTARSGKWRTWLLQSCTNAQACPCAREAGVGEQGYPSTALKRYHTPQSSPYQSSMVLHILPSCPPYPIAPLGHRGAPYVQGLLLPLVLALSRHGEGKAPHVFGSQTDILMVLSPLAIIPPSRTLV